MCNSYIGVRKILHFHFKVGLMTVRLATNLSELALFAELHAYEDHHRALRSWKLLQESGVDPSGSSNLTKLRNQLLSTEKILEYPEKVSK